MKCRFHNPGPGCGRHCGLRDVAWMLCAFVLISAVFLMAACGGGGDNSSSRQELAMPAGWGGQWDLTLNFKYSDTGNLVAVDEYSAPLCDDDPMAFSMLPLLTGCDQSLDGDILYIDCRDDYTYDECSVCIQLDLEVARAGDSLDGDGAWAIVLTGDCSQVNYRAGSETIEVAGTRTDPNPFECQ